MNWLDFSHVKLNFCASSAQYDILYYQSTKKCEQNTLKIFISLFIFTLLYSDSLSFSDDVAKTTRTGKTRRRMCLSGNKSAKSNSNDSTAKTIRTWRISSTLFRVKDHIVIPTILFSLKKEAPDRRLSTYNDGKEFMSDRVNFCVKKRNQVFLPVLSHWKAFDNY